jgi:hypothetical protein
MSEAEKSVYQIFLEGLEGILPQKEFEAAKKKVVDQAFEDVFRNDKKGLINWKRSGPNLDEYTAETVITNAKGIRVTINIYLTIEEVILHLHNSYRCVALFLASKSNAPSLYSENEEVRALYEKLTEKKFSAKL